jgi:hypothetical protein
LLEFAAILKAIAWPVVVFLAVWFFRKQLSLLISAFSTKIERSTRISIGGKRGIELIEEVVRGSIVTSGGATTQERFEALALEYDDLRIGGNEERVEARHKLANQLGDLAVKLRLARGALSDSNSEGKLVALATAALLKPMPRDITTLAKASEKANFNFTRYRIVLSVTPTLARADVSASTLDTVDAILNNVEHRPDVATDPPLQRLIEKTRAAVDDLRVR